MTERTCTVDGCERSPRSATADWCNAHYFRWYRNGAVGPAAIVDQSVKRHCKVDGCERKHYGDGLCNLHYQRNRSHGDPHTVLPNVRHRDEHWAWKGDSVGYTGAHDRVRSERGPASDHRCCSCGAPAKHWAYDHGDPNERVSQLGPYSPLTEHYQPMCVSCHKSFDLAHLGRARVS